MAAPVDLVKGLKMLPARTRLGASHRALMDILRATPDLRHGPALTAALDLLAQRRGMDLSDLSPGEQAALIGARAKTVLPSVSRLAVRLRTAPLIVKFGIDPTAADVHAGHAVPMILASRFQRMGHRVVFIVGDITAKIGDPSGWTTDRPQLTDADIARNMATYREQVTPFFDFQRAEFRFNSEWLTRITLPRLLGALTMLPASAALQRDDFRKRLAAGRGLTMAELVYSVVMALDSVEIVADVEIGGLDQLLNLQMCRRVMTDAGQEPEVVIATTLIEGTDAAGTKMSKSKGNVVGLASEPRDVFGKVMSAPDRLLPEWLRALTELLDPEVDLLLAEGHPMGVKTLLASDLTATLHGLDTAATCRGAFAAQFSRRRLSGTPGLPVINAVQHGHSTVAEVFARVAGLVPSLNQVRRVAAGGGLRLVLEGDEGQRSIRLTDADAALADVLAAHAVTPDRIFVTCGRSVIELLV
jgi:tyrosyl-tRNA synthetase